MLHISILHFSKISIFSITPMFSPLHQPLVLHFGTSFTDKTHKILTKCTSNDRHIRNKEIWWLYWIMLYFLVVLHIILYAQDTQ